MIQKWGLAASKGFLVREILFSALNYPYTLLNMTLKKLVRIRFFAFFKVPPQPEMAASGSETGLKTLYAQVKILKVWARDIWTPISTHFEVAESEFHI